MELVQQVKDVHQRLLDWERTIPPELRLESFPKRMNDSGTDKISKIFRLQAFALQDSYDNIQLLLHRPLLSLVGRPRRVDHPSTHKEEGLGQSFASERELNTDVARTSKHQCWESAIRTSLLVEYSDVWEAASKSPLGAHIGIHAFTAGVMLGIFALSSPLSSQAQDAKHGIARIIRMPCIEGYKAPIWPQSTKILEDLLKLILAEEMKALLSGSVTESTRQRGSSKLVGHNGSASHLNHYAGGTVSEQHSTSTGINQFPAIRSYGQESASQPQQAVHGQEWSQPQSYQDAFLSPDSGFEDAFLSLQNGKYCCTFLCFSIPSRSGNRSYLIESIVIFGGFSSAALDPIEHSATSLDQNTSLMSALGYQGVNETTNSAQYGATSNATVSSNVHPPGRNLDHFDDGGQMWMWRV